MVKISKINSFWNPTPIPTRQMKQSKNNFNSKPLKPFKPLKPLFSPKFIQPVNLKTYPTRTKQENKLINKNPFGDRDRDGVPNIFDCKPLDNKLQDKPAFIGKENYPQKVRTKKPLEPRNSINKLKNIPKQSTQVKKTGMFLEDEKVYWGEGWTPGGWRVPSELYNERYNDLVKNKKVPSAVARKVARIRPTRYKTFIKVLEERGVNNINKWRMDNYGMERELERLKEKKEEITALREKGIPLKKGWANKDPRMENYRKLVSMGVPPKIAVIAKSKNVTDRFVEGKLKLEDLEKMFRERGEERWKNVADKKRINYEKLQKLGFNSYETNALSTRSIKNVDEIVSNVKKHGIEQARKKIAGLTNIIKKNQSEYYFIKLKGNPRFIEQRKRAQRIRNARPEVREKLNEYNREYNAKPENKIKDKESYAAVRIQEMAPGLEFGDEYKQEKIEKRKREKEMSDILKSGDELGIANYIADNPEDNFDDYGTDYESSAQKLIDDVGPDEFDDDEE